MKAHTTYLELLRALEGDHDLMSHLFELGVVAQRAEGYLPEEVERALVAYTLVRELGVNWEGVDVILRLLEELLDTRRQVVRLVELLQEPRSASVWGVRISEGKAHQ